jgi:hypothetical protein
MAVNKSLGFSDITLAGVSIVGKIQQGVLSEHRKALIFCIKKWSGI